MVWPAHFSPTARRNNASMASSSAPLRNSARTSYSSVANKQVRNCPSAVSRTRSQSPQNGLVTVGITPTVPLPSRYRQRSAGAAPRLAICSSANTSLIVDTISSWPTTALFNQPPWASSGMNSINRTSMFFSRPNVARAIISSSFTPRCTTAFTFTGAMPTAIAASMPSSTEASSSRLVICLNFSRFSVSRLTLMRRKPARFKSAATNASVAPLVVTATSMG